MTAFVREGMLSARRRRAPSPSEVTANAPADMLDHYLRRRIERAAEERALSAEKFEDALAAELAMERLLSMDAEGSVPWDVAKKDLDVD